MAVSARVLLDDIERDILSDDVPTSTLLRRCIVLGGRAGSPKLRDWASRELNGYDKIDDLPPYRRVTGLICLDAIVGNNKITGQQISSLSLPKFVQDAGVDQTVHLTLGLGELEAITKRTEESVNLALPSSSDLVAYMNSESEEPFQQILSLYWKVSKSTIKGVIDRIRTALAELIGELIASTPTTDSAPTSEAADQAVNLVVTGKRNRVNVSTSQVQTGTGNTNIAPASSPDTTSWWRRWRNRGIVVGIATILGASVTVATWAGWTPWS